MRAAVMFAGALVGCMPADVGGTYEVTASELFDDCAVSEGPYPAFVMFLGQIDGWVQVSFPIAGAYRDDFFHPVADTLGFTSVVEGSTITGALEGSYRALGETCGFFFRLDLDAEVDGRELTGRLTISDREVFPAGCAPQPKCQTQQALQALRLP